MAHTRESISKELKRIQDSVPQLFKDLTLKEVEAFPVVTEIAQQFLDSPDIPEDKKEKVRKLIEEGRMGKKKIIENPKIAQQRDKWVEREIKKSVKAGRLPDKKTLQKLKILELHEEGGHTGDNETSGI